MCILKTTGYTKFEIIFNESGAHNFVQANDVPRKEVDSVQWGIILSDIQNGMSLRESILRLYD